MIRFHRPSGFYSRRSKWESDTPFEAVGRGSLITCSISPIIRTINDDNHIQGESRTGSSVKYFLQKSQNCLILVQMDRCYR